MSTVSTRHHPRRHATPRISTRLAGHALRDEGKAYQPTGYGISRRVQVGCAHCECGATSPELYSDYARKKWHRKHKDEIRTQAT